MGIFVDRMATLKVAVVSPDNQIRAVCTQATPLDITLRPGSYEGYQDSALELELAALLDLLHTGWCRARRQALEEATGAECLPDERRDLDSSQRRFRALLAEVTSMGRSSGNLVKIRNTAMANWQVKIRPETLRRLGQDEFVHECISAYDDLRRSRRRQVTEARVAVYGENRFRLRRAA